MIRLRVVTAFSNYRVGQVIERVDAEARRMLGLSWYGHKLVEVEPKPESKRQPAPEPKIAPAVASPAPVPASAPDSVPEPEPIAATTFYGSRKRKESVK